MPAPRALVPLAALLGAFGCTPAVSQPPRSAPPPAVDHADTDEDAPAHGHRGPIPPDIVERSAMPFHGLRTADNTPLSDEELLDDLSRADAICVGEDHDNPHSHWAQLRVLSGLIERRGMSGREIGIGLEMVSVEQQDVLDDFQTGKIDSAELAKQLDWEETWGWAFDFYRPMLEVARDEGLTILGLNVPRQLPRLVAKYGPDDVEDHWDGKLPELDLTDAEHKRWFKSVMRAHPSPHASPDRMYAAQVVWDEGMAEAAAAWLRDRIPGRQLLILAGAGHCWSRAIPKRLERRTSARVATVRPVVLPAADHPLPEVEEGYDYLFLMAPEE
jgi:uncharacterized iron-regulated protein